MGGLGEATEGSREPAAECTFRETVPNFAGFNVSCVPFVEGEGGDVAGGTDGRSDACAAGDGEHGELPPSSPRRTSSPDREADEAPRKQPKTGA